MPLAHHAKMSAHQRQTWMRKQVREIEIDCKKKRKEDGKSVLGKAAMFEVDPRDRPKNPKKSGRAPLCHASDPEKAKAFKKEWRAFMDRFIEASADYRNGNFDREFPEGSYRPPLITIYSASKL